ncbi:hypothetical protein [Methanocella conradii]|nr:hypothetical protein [Methanocella conradii]
MKPNKILVLALAGLMLAVTTSSTAFAYIAEYSGTDYSHITGPSSVANTGTITEQIPVAGSVQLRWKNDLKNDMSSGNAYFGIQYSSGYAGGLNWESSGDLYLPPNGYHVEVTVTTPTVDTTYMPPLPTTDTLNINHKYRAASSPYWYGTDFWQTQKYEYLHL